MDQLQQLKAEILERVERYCRELKASEPAFTPGASRVNYAGRVYDEREMAQLVDSALEFWLTAGRYADRFERGLAGFLGVRHCSLCNSGSSANLLAFIALTAPELGERRIRRGDEVITVAAAFPTTVAPIVQYGAVPVFVDATLPGYNADAARLEAALSDKTKAVMLAHTLGNPFDLGAVKDFCDRHNLWLIEDNCDALGSKYRGRYTGTFGHLGTSSFYPPHHITLGEGGAVYTDDPQLHRLVNSFRDWGRDCWCPPGRDNSCGRRFDGQFGRLPAGFDHKFVYSHFGYNLKITDLQAAVGCAQLEKLPAFVEARRHNYARLRERLRALEDRFVFSEALPGAEPSWFGFPLTVKDGAGFERNEIVQYLEANRIQTRNLFAGNLLKHPCFMDLIEGRDYRVAGTMETTDRIMHNTFWIGVYPGISDAACDYMAGQIETFVGARPARG